MKIIALNKYKINGGREPEDIPSRGEKSMSHYRGEAGQTVPSSPPHRKYKNCSRNPPRLGRSIRKCHPVRGKEQSSHNGRGVSSKANIKKHRHLTSHVSKPQVQTLPNAEQFVGSHNIPSGLSFRACSGVHYRVKYMKTKSKLHLPKKKGIKAIRRRAKLFSQDQITNFQTYTSRTFGVVNYSSH